MTCLLSGAHIGRADDSASCFLSLCSHDGYDRFTLRPALIRYDLQPEYLMPVFSRFRFLWLFLLLSLFFLSSPSCAATEPPFVAGFERFFRHTASVDGGPLLLSELACVNCHQTMQPEWAPKSGPDLQGIALRVQPKWLRDFLRSPSRTKPGTTMPDIVATLPVPEQEVAVAALAAYLATQQSPLPVLNSTAGNPIAMEFWQKGDPERGLHLYHQVGCVACHAPDEKYDVGNKPSTALEKLLRQLDEDELKELGLSEAARPVKPVPHARLPEKYTAKGLTHFLLNPSLFRPGGRMPNFQLTAAEAADISSYLLHGHVDNPNAINGPRENDLISKGRTLFTDLKCVGCHQATGIDDAIRAPALSQLNLNSDFGCIGKPSPATPHFPIDEIQRDALRNVTAELANIQSMSDSDFRMQQLNCYACHSRNNRGGVGPHRRRYFETAGHVDLGDEGRLPPPLTGVGKKLTRKWLDAVLAGNGDIRPYVLARMPVYPEAEVKPLAAAIVRADLSSAQTELAVFGELTSLAEHGRMMVDVGCVQCHPMRGEKLPGVVGIDLEGISSRVRPEWFRDFLLNPVSLKERTRMPTFFPNGKSTNTEILNGQVDRQIAAVWAYVKDIQKLPLPDRIEQGKVDNFELIPKDKPILLRTFMQNAGTHAIAVGFPQKIHFAFDAETVRVAQFWRGRFIDAHGTWFDRFTPLAKPLSTDVAAAGAGPSFAVLSDLSSAWPDSVPEDSRIQFGGFRLDEFGVPTFLYRIGNVQIADRLVPMDDSIHRTLSLKTDSSSVTRNLWFRLLVGKKLTKVNDAEYRNEAGLAVTVNSDTASRSTVHESENEMSWLLPVSASDDVTVKVRYSW